MQKLGCKSASSENCDACPRFEFIYETRLGELHMWGPAFWMPDVVICFYFYFLYAIATVKSSEICEIYIVRSWRKCSYSFLRREIYWWVRFDCSDPQPHAYWADDLHGCFSLFPFSTRLQRCAKSTGINMMCMWSECVVWRRHRYKFHSV